MMRFWGIDWGKCYCIQWCVSEVQGEGNIILYSDVCLSYIVREMILCRVMWVWGTGWRKCYCTHWSFSEENVTVYIRYVSEVQVEGKFSCIHWCVYLWYKASQIFIQGCVSEVQVERNFTVENEVCLRCRVSEMLLYTTMCVLGTVGRKCYCTKWCVYLWYKEREIFQYIMMYVWGTGGG